MTSITSRAGVSVAAGAAPMSVASGVLVPYGYPQNAASIASLLFTTEAVICELPAKKGAAGGGMPSGGGTY